MLMNGLFTLLKMNTIMDKTLLQDPKECMVILMNIKTTCTLHNKFVVTSRQWYTVPITYCKSTSTSLHVFSIIATIFVNFMLHLVSPCVN